MHFMEHKWTYYPAYYLNERLPALLYSAFARSPMGNATHRKNAEKLNKVQEKSLIVAQTFRFFVSNEWVFTTTKLLKMYSSLHPDDRRDFDFDPAHIDW
jgi:hypothetical protein